MKPLVKTTPPVDPYQILSVLFKRYSELAQKNTAKLDGLAPKCQSAALVSLCNEAIGNGKDYPFDKMNRWLGFTQGVLAAAGLIDVDAEREYTRPLLHLLHVQPVKSWPAKPEQ